MPVDIEPGMVFYLPFANLHGQRGINKNKYAIVVQSDPDALTFMICTEIPGFAERNSKLRRSYAKIAKRSHNFLDYDSWVDCNEAKTEYTLQKLKAAYEADNKCLVGQITLDQAKLIRGCADKSVRLERRKKRSICSALDRLINSLAQ